MDQFWSSPEQCGVRQTLGMSLVDDKAKARYDSQPVLCGTDADEIMVNGQTFGHQARLHSFELAMDVKEESSGQCVLMREALSELTTPSYVDLISEAHQALYRQQKCRIRHR